MSRFTLYNEALKVAEGRYLKSGSENTLSYPLTIKVDDAEALDVQKADGTSLVHFDTVTFEMELDGRLDHDVTVTDHATAQYSASSHTLDVYTTGNNSRVHLAGFYVVNYRSDDTLTSSGNGIGGYIMQATNLGTGTVASGGAATLTVTNEGGGTFTDGHGILFAPFNSAPGTFTNFWALDLTDFGASFRPTNQYFANFTTPYYGDTSKSSVKVIDNKTTAYYMPVSTTATGYVAAGVTMTFGSTTSGECVLVSGDGIVRELAGTKNDGLVTLKLTETQTTNDTQTAIGTFALLDENTYDLVARVIGVESDGSNRASYQIAATVYRTGAGSATIQGTVTALHAAESDASWDVTFTVSGNNVSVSVTGVAATTIEWGGYLQYFNMSN